jgi:hypothetical protein
MFRLLKIGAFVLSLAVFGVLTTNCGTDHSKVRFVHASSDAGSIDVAVDGKTVATDLAFGDVSPSSDYLTVTAGTRKVEVRPTGTTNDLINSNVSLGSGKNYSVVASGLANPPPGTIAAIVLTDDNTAPTSGNVKLRIVHVSPSVTPLPGATIPGPVDVYVVAPGTDITGMSPTIPGLAYTQASAYQNIAAGSTEVIVTRTTDQNPIVDQTYDLASGQNRTLVLLDNGAVPNPVTTLLQLSDLN